MARGIVYTAATAEFSQKALRKIFSREGVPTVLVTDNGSHFTAKEFDEWLTGTGCKHLYTAPRHPRSNGQAEKFVRTLKSAIASSGCKTFGELDKYVDNFLLQYRNAVHATTKECPSKLSKGRILRSHICRLDSSEVKFYKGNDLRQCSGLILRNLGQRMLKIMDLEDLTIHNRHVDQVQFMESDTTVQEVPELSTVLPTDINEENSTEANDNVIPRRSMRIQQRMQSNAGSKISCRQCDNE